ncbi:MAG: right-handed parallel beta-helix repeat-containing protein, partial [Chloroflexota bacterium]|nr:right-handed parallel beta-helix repeat-containing protein [Chloroflexota bacterium]
DLLSRNLNPKQPLRGNYHFVDWDGETFLRVDLVNLMVIPVQIREFAGGGVTLPFEKAWCITQKCQSKTINNLEETVLLAGDTTDFIPAPFYIPLGNIDQAKIAEENPILRVNLYGGSQIFDIPLSPSYVPQGLETGIKPSATLEEALNAHPYLRLAGEGQLTIAVGDWDVNSDLILPKGYDLIIPEGTTLRFAAESVFLSHGAINIHGTEESPVLLTAQADSWGGMVVLGASEASHWKHAKVEKMAGIPYPGWALTGGITFYQSDVDISYSKIGNNTTEDALNVIQAHISMNVVEFMHTSSDAFDGDFVSGTISHCNFHNIKGDAFDTSGSQVEITDSLFTNIADKAISAGEGSKLTLRNLTIRNVSIGIASKDNSTIAADSIIIDSANIAGLAAYIKKPQYGPASLEAVNVEILNTETPALCQTESQLSLNGESISAQDFDVDALYEQGVLGN